jgi:hypothetical protein
LKGGGTTQNPGTDANTWRPVLLDIVEFVVHDAAKVRTPFVLYQDLVVQVLFLLLLGSNGIGIVVVLLLVVAANPDLV